TVSVGTGASGSTAGSNGTPIYRSSAASTFDFSQSVQLYTQQDLNSAGIFSGATISSIGLFKTNAFTLVSGANASLTINMNNSSNTALSTADTFANLTSGAQVVYQSATVDNTVIPGAAGVVVFQLTTPFVYTGGSIEIGFDWDVSSFTGSPTDGAFSWAYDNAPAIQARGTSAAAAITGNLTGTFSRRHQLQATFTGGTPCTSPPTAGTAVITNGSASSCSGASITLGVTGDAPGVGSSYQWEFAADNINFAPVAGATNSVYSFTINTGSSGSYRRVETCATTSAASSSVAVTSLILQPDAAAEIFDTYLPNCWTEAQGLLGPVTTLTGTTSGWVADGFLNNGTTGSARIEIWTTSTDEWLISPSYNLTGNEQLVFDLGITFWNSTASPGLTGVDDRFAVVISTDDGLTWTDANTLRLWDNAGSANVYNDISNTGETIILDLSSYTGVVKFGFYGESTVSNADNNVYVDNVQVRTIPSCLDVTDLIFTSSTTTTADFTWNSNNPNTSGVFEYLVDSMNSYPTGPDATVTPTGTFPTGNSSATTPVAQAAQVTGLSPSTVYNMYVREVCSGTDRSPWTSAVNFTTECAPITDFSENFDSVSTPNLPVCWTSFNTVLATGTSPEVVTSTAADNSLPNGVALDSNS
ncbi:MAG: fibronectin type III domain-containing protein, partial [Nonlabens sp.]|nr:fibronectin type III domain-containing protein [Nonlabens sp.]